MKITRKILENIIKEELAKVLQEQDPIKQKEKMIADLEAKIKAENDSKKKAELKKQLEKLKADLAGPGGNADQASRVGRATTNYKKNLEAFRDGSLAMPSKP